MGSDFLSPVNGQWGRNWPKHKHPLFGLLPAFAFLCLERLPCPLRASPFPSSLPQVSAKKGTGLQELLTQLLWVAEEKQLVRSRGWADRRCLHWPNRLFHQLWFAPNLAEEKPSCHAERPFPRLM